jgi:hypothetical protein
MDFSLLWVPIPTTTLASSERCRMGNAVYGVVMEKLKEGIFGG